MNKISSVKALKTKSIELIDLFSDNIKNLENTKNYPKLRKEIFEILWKKDIDKLLDVLLYLTYIKVNNNKKYNKLAIKLSMECVIQLIKMKNLEESTILRIEEILLNENIDPEIYLTDNYKESIETLLNYE